jgi:hypothetical protein
MIFAHIRSSKNERKARIRVKGIRILNVMYLLKIYIPKIWYTKKRYNITEKSKIDKDKINKNRKFFGFNFHQLPLLFFFLDIWNNKD